MRKLIMSLNISLDGYADHTVAAGGDDLHDFFSDLMDETGIELFGRVTYQMMEHYWPEAEHNPNSSQSDRDFAKRFNEVPKVVFSSSLDKAEWSHTTLVKTNAIDYVRQLKNTEGKPLNVGGISLAGALADSGLVDEYWVVVHPVIAGSGRRFLEGVKKKFDLKLLETRPLKSGAIALHYQSVAKT